MTWIAPPVDASTNPCGTSPTCEQQAARAAVADLALDDVHLHPRFGAMSPRWAFNHMIAEYAQHNGHADLLREQVAGTTRI